VTYGLIGGSVVVAIWILILVGWAIVQIAAGGKL
jgi:purine-cytosine permease-like protein